MGTSKAGRATASEKCTMERDQCPNRENFSRHSQKRLSAAEDRSTYVCGVGSGAGFDAKGQTLPTRKAMVDGGPDATSADLHVWKTTPALSGPTVQSNREGIAKIINDALDWERRSGATFEADKTAIIHFAPKARKVDQEPFKVKDQTVEPQNKVKILGVLMDTRLKYKEHIARTASKGLEAAMELRRLRGLSPATARQLFSSTVAPVVDYASNVWMHAFKNKSIGPINRVQRVGAQAIVGTFLTVATRVAEAEAHIATARHRFWRRAVKMWTDLHTLPETNPLRRNTDRIRKFRRYRQIAGNHQSVYASTMGNTRGN